MAVLRKQSFQLFECAGKTTLINQIVCGEHGFRIAVILNEFGEELGIEKALLQEQVCAVACWW